VESRKTSIAVEDRFKVVPFEEFCEIAHIGHSRGYEFLNSGDVKSVLVGRRRLVFIQSWYDYLERLLEEQRTFTPGRHPASRQSPPSEPADPLTDLLVKGIVDGEKIRAELDVSSFFVTVADEPAWRTVWYAYQRTEDEFNAALAEMERAFAAREFVVIGEILHVLGLRLWLSGIGVLMKTRAEVVEEGKCYINDLYSDGRIEPASPHDRDSDLSFGGYAGLGIHENETSEFKEVFAYLHKMRQAAELDRHPTIAKDLLKDMAEDPDRFFRRVNLINDEANDFYDVPILAAIDPNCFVKALLNHHPARQRTVLNALKVRYGSRPRPWCRRGPLRDNAVGRSRAEM
jgi:hypothetical protein